MILKFKFIIDVKKKMNIDINIIHKSAEQSLAALKELGIIS